jgi:hypothetical protein
MAGKGLGELALKDEALPAQTYDDLPEFGGYTPPPQPGPYRFKLPAIDKLGKAYEAFDTDKGQRIKVLFDKDAPLTITQAKDASKVGDTYQTRISNLERKRGDIETSDFDYLLKALGEKQKPKNLRGYIETLNKHAGQEFGADIAFSWHCDDKRNIYARDAEGKLSEVEGTKGCGRRYYQADKTKKDEQKIARLEDGTYPTNVVCSCGAEVRCFANLDNIRA